MTTHPSSVQEQHATAGSFQIRYLEKSAPAGSPVVVLLHDGAWGASAEATWGRTFSFIPDDLRVIAPDLLGFGGSDKAVFLDRSPYGFRAKAVFDLLETLGVTEPVHIVGNSFGGSVALRALELPELAGRIASVTTISGTGGPWRSELALRELGAFDGTESDMGRIMKLVTDPFEGWDEYLTERIEWAKAPGHFGTMVAPHQKAPETLSVERPADPFPGSLAGIKVPVHIIAGLRDPLVEPGWPALLADAIGGAAHVSEIDGGHSPNLDQPGETWQLVEGFIRENAR